MSNLDQWEVEGGKLPLEFKPFGEIKPMEYLVEYVDVEKFVDEYVEAHDGTIEPTQDFDISESE